MLGRLVEIQGTGLMLKNSTQIGFLVLQLITKGKISNTFHLELEEGPVQVYHLVLLTLN